MMRFAPGFETSGGLSVVSFSKCEPIMLLAPGCKPPGVLTVFPSGRVSQWCPLLLVVNSSCIECVYFSQYELIMVLPPGCKPAGLLSAFLSARVSQ